MYTLLVIVLFAASAPAQEEGPAKCYKTGDVYTAENMNLPSCDLDDKSNLDVFKNGKFPNQGGGGGSPWNNQGGGSFSSSGVGGGGNGAGGAGGRAPASTGGASGFSNPTSTGSSSPNPSPTPSSSSSSGGTGGSDYNQTHQNSGDAHWIK